MGFPYQFPRFLDAQNHQLYGLKATYEGKTGSKKGAQKKNVAAPPKNVLDIEKSSSQKVAHMVAWLIKHRKNREPPITLKKSLEVGQGGTSKNCFISIFKNIGSQGFPRIF